jgi:cytidylate kinase
MGVTIAIDGPAGAGKSTVARTVAERLGYVLVDTGAIYRSVALLARRGEVALEDDEALARIVGNLEVSFRLKEGRNRVFLAGEEVSSAIREPEISMAASAISARPVVRAGLLELQRRLAAAGDGAVLEGRDIGTVVCPQAEVKVFLGASAEERARRRHLELQASGDATPYEEVLAEMNLRDQQDSERAVAPLAPAGDAVIIDSTRMTIEEVVERVVTLARRRV